MLRHFLLPLSGGTLRSYLSHRSQRLVDGHSTPAKAGTSHWRPAIQLLFTIAIFISCAVSTVQAQYLFRVPSMDVEVFVQPDASARISYKIVFENQGRAIDVVDVGLPHKGYKISNMSASINGQSLSSIKKSTYIDTGVEVALGSFQIGSGQSGTFEFTCTMPNLVYQDTTDKSYASLQFKPTWFDQPSTVGTTNLRVAIHLLPEVEPADVRFQEEANRYTDLALVSDPNAQDKKHVVARWSLPDKRLSENNPKLSVSFPKEGMQRVVKMGPFGLFYKWFSESKEAQTVSLVGLIGCLAFMFYRFSNGTGCVVFLFLAGMLFLFNSVAPWFHFLSWPSLLGLTWLNERNIRSRRDNYLPAMATVEGGGIKRGLTAPQAAVLLELPLGKIVSLVLVGLLKKKIARLVTADPVQVDIAKEYITTRKKRRDVAAKRGVVIHDYEQAFIDRLQTETVPVKKLDLNEALGGLIESVGKRMKGFDLSDTKAYYERIVARAFAEAKSLGDVGERTRSVDRNIEWMMMDSDWIDIFGDWSRSSGGSWRYDPGWGRIPGSGGGGGIDIGGGGDRGSGGTTTLSEVASSFAGWTESFANNIASTIEPVKMGLDIPKGVVDLSAIDKMTADVFEALAESGKSGGGGGGGGCACACAGCACACACAGGGR